MKDDQYITRFTIPFVILRKYYVEYQFGGLFIKVCVLYVLYKFRLFFSPEARVITK